MSSRDLIADLKRKAQEIGFDRIGVAQPNTSRAFGHYQAWMKQGHAADMWYLTESSRVGKRGDLTQVLPGIRSVIVGAISYTPASAPPSELKFGRYAWGVDYHGVVERKLKELVRWLRASVAQSFEVLTYVDTGPVLERALAEQAGIGWVGKNSCLIDEEIGSYFFLGEILTTLELSEFDRPPPNRCGTCTRCIDACPTKALVAPYQLDSRRCISYQTIENRSPELDQGFHGKLKGWVAGCDICQEVCPWNQGVPPHQHEELAPLPHLRLTPSQAERLEESEHRQLFAKTSLKRISWKSFLRNVRAAARHS